MKINDLEFGDIVTFKNKKGTSIYVGCGVFGTIKAGIRMGLDIELNDTNIMKVQRYIHYNNRETLYELKTIYERKEILDKVEKEYLRAIIKPFRKKVAYIVKYKSETTPEEYISIDGYKICPIYLPYFKKGTMYRGMKPDKIYTLEELGL